MNMTTVDLRQKVGHNDLYFIDFVFFFIHQEMALAGGIRAPLGACSSFPIQKYRELVVTPVSLWVLAWALASHLKPSTTKRNTWAQLFEASLA